MPSFITYKATDLHKYQVSVAQKTMCDRCSKAFLQTTGVLRVVLPNMSAAVSLSVSSDVRLRFSWTTATYQGSRKLHWT